MSCWKQAEAHVWCHNIISLKAVLTPLALKDVEKTPNLSKCVEFGVNLVRHKKLVACELAVEQWNFCVFLLELVKH